MAETQDAARRVTDRGKDDRASPPQLIHVRMLEAEERKDAPMPRDERARRILVLVALAVSTTSAAYSLFVLGDHPFRTLAASIGAAITLAIGAVPALFSQRPDSVDAWARAAFDGIAGRAARSMRHTLALAAALLVLAFLAWFFGAHAVIDADLVACPAGVQLEYGTLGARTECDGDHDHVWAPAGIASVARTFRCVHAESGATWAPFHRASHTDEATGAVRDPRFVDERFSCFEDGALVVPSTDCAGHTLSHLEYGWGTDRPDRPLPAPCDDQPPGVYAFDPDAHACTPIEPSRCMLACSPPLPADATATLSVDPSCDAACGDALPRLADALAHGATPGVRAWLAGFGDGDVQLRHPRHRGVYKIGQLELLLTERQLAFPIGVSYRLSAGTRCVPPDDRRDGFLHVFQRDRETVLAYFDDGADARGLCVVETSFATAPPAGIASGCTRE